MKPEVYSFFKEYVELCKKHRMHIDCDCSENIDATPSCYINYVTAYNSKEGYVYSEGTKVPADEIINHLFELMNAEKETVDYSMNFGITDEAQHNQATS